MTVLADAVRMGVAGTSRTISQASAQNNPGARRMPVASRARLSFVWTGAARRMPVAAVWRTGTPWIGGQAGGGTTGASTGRFVRITIT